MRYQVVVPTAEIPWWTIFKRAPACNHGCVACRTRRIDFCVGSSKSLWKAIWQAICGEVMEVQS